MRPSHLLGATISLFETKESVFWIMSISLFLPEERPIFRGSSIGLWAALQLWNKEPVLIFHPKELGTNRKGWIASHDIEKHDTALRRENLVQKFWEFSDLFCEPDVNSYGLGTPCSQTFCVSLSTSITYRLLSSKLMSFSESEWFVISSRSSKSCMGGQITKSWNQDRLKYWWCNFSVLVPV
jgi:hypothetical protein